MKLERFILVMTPEKDENFVCLSALLCEQILPIREWKCQDIDQVLLHGDHFFSAHSAALKC